MVKVLFDGCDFVSRTGPNTFASRLAMQLFETGHVIADPDDYDVVLAFIEPSFPIEQYRAPVVQRLDGIWFKDDEEFRNKNVGIKNCYLNASHVIFQSSFDKAMVEKWWGSVNNSTINNGVKMKPIVDLSRISTGLQSIRNQHDKVFVCSSNWHGQKRFLQNVELFRHLKMAYPSSCLIVLGNNAPRIAGNDIFYAGNVSHELCAEAYAIADWMIHLGWLDHCPNVVVECLAQGTPVICSEAGGTKELVKDFGIVLSENEPYEYQLVDYDSPPPLDVTQLSVLPSIDSLGSHADIDIATVGRQYVKVLEKVVRLG